MDSTMTVASRTEETPLLDSALLKEGLDYAEKNFLSTNSHLYLDKEVLKKRFDLKGKDVLDFGCGMGNTSLWLAKEMGARVDGFDLDPNHIMVAKELNRKHKIPGVRFELRNIIEKPIEKQYDFIMLNGLLNEEIYIMDMTGRVIKRSVDHSGKISVKEIPDGIYYISVKEASRVLSSKILIIHR